MKEMLWQPSLAQTEQAAMTSFIQLVNRKYGRDFRNYDDLYQWSIQKAPEFWETMWEFGQVVASQPYQQVVANLDDMLESRWFVGAKLNFAENLLRYRDDRTAIIFKGEGKAVESLTYAQLYDQVARLARTLHEIGVKAEDRVAGFLPNCPQTVVAMLATTSIGAIWSSSSPDFGIKGVLDRFVQIQPKVLFTADGYNYNGKTHDSLAKAKQIAAAIPSVEQVVVVPYVTPRPEISDIPGAVLYEDFLALEDGISIEFNQLPFNHPIYIMYSSGTTGVPKCIVHGGGGLLIQHLKEHLLHTNLTREDVVFYFTTCGWMMWNWLVSVLAVGATIVLYDGSPTFPEIGALWQLAQEVGITVFGTSAKYLASIEKAGLKPVHLYQLSKLKTILSTGSPLSLESFHYVYRDIKEDVCLSSITGGTDLVSTFALGNPLLPVYAGELQCRGLGMKVESFDSAGRPVLNQKGELVCTLSFPAMPVYFWNDPDQMKYKKAYFEVYPNVWRHGDYVEISDTGGVIVYGRSDATLNPGGVRIGTAEIYRQVEALPEIADSLVIGQEWQGDERVILFIRLVDGCSYTPELVEKIKQSIRANTTPRHVPAKIIPVEDIPYTISGKKVELAVKQIVQNLPVENKDALANPASLELFKNLLELTN